MAKFERLFQIKEVAFGELHYGTSDYNSIAPKYHFIPKEFKFGDNKWRDAAEYWFYKGLHKDSKLIPKRMIDKEAAIRHIQCLLNCWLINHKYKIAAAAYLLSQWFEDVEMVKFDF